MTCAAESRISKVSGVLAAAVFIVIAAACAPPAKPFQGEMVFTGSAQDQRLLVHHEINASQLAAPNQSKSSDNGPTLAPPTANDRLHLSAGFTIQPFAEGMATARWMTQATNGDIFVSDGDGGKIYILRGMGSDGRAKERLTFAEKLNLPFGLAFWNGYLYFAETNRVLRFKYRDGQTHVEGTPEKIADLPGEGYNQHWTRNLAFSPDGKKLYVSVGSQSNDSVDPAPRASILEMNPDGSGQRIFASGMRNPVGMAFDSAGKLWSTVNERDGLGDDLPPDYLTQVREGGFYGWPFSYAGSHPDPRHPGERPELVSRAIVPDVLIQAHSAALGLAFNRGGMFPKDYAGDAFVALHGSWNRAKRTGYKIIRVHLQNGRPTGGYDDFITGWSANEADENVWGRPVGLLFLHDGSLLICDDGGRRIWRVTYKSDK